MMKNNDKRKGNNTKKLIPAAGMLAMSASMLATSTYAWFTMSREVEVTNIKMTATVPEDLQISLGEISSGSASVNLASNNGFINCDTADIPNAPADSDDDDPYDWSNSVDISNYYDFGKLIPAGSTNGSNVYFTPDSAGVGKTLKDGATAYKAAEAATAQNETGNGAGAGTGKFNATAHIKTDGETTWANNDASSAGADKYTTASAWNNTNDDGYYIDIPIWLRTSSTTAPSIYVTGYIKDGTNASSQADEDGDELYKAVRVAILDADGGAAGGVLDLSDQTDAATAAYPSTQVAAASSLIDSAIATGNYNTLTNTSALANNGAMTADLYGDVTVNKGATAVGTLTAKAANATTQYAAGTKFIIRVWLEGDDQNCWNANAGQDWSIALKFMTSALPTTSTP